MSCATKQTDNQDGIALEKTPSPQKKKQGETKASVLILSTKQNAFLLFILKICFDFFFDFIAEEERKVWLTTFSICTWIMSVCPSVCPIIYGSLANYHICLFPKFLHWSGCWLSVFQSTAVEYWTFLLCVFCGLFKENDVWALKPPNPFLAYANKKKFATPRPQLHWLLYMLMIVNVFS